MNQAMYALWAQGTWLEDIHAAVSSMTTAEVESAMPHATARVRLDVDFLGFSADDATRVGMIHNCLKCMPFEARVDLKMPSHHLWLLLAQPCRHLGLKDMPQVAFLGLLLGESGQKPLNKRFMLSARRYLGPTSMDTTLAFVMANMGQAARGRVCADPFVGTGSCLIAAAALGAHVLGADIDMRVIKCGKVGCGLAMRALNTASTDIWMDADGWMLMDTHAHHHAHHTVHSWTSVVNRSTCGQTLPTMACPPPSRCCAVTCTGVHGDQGCKRYSTASCAIHPMECGLVGASRSLRSSRHVVVGGVAEVC